MNESQSAIKRPRTEQVRNYMSVLVDKTTNASNDPYKNTDTSANDSEPFPFDDSAQNNPPDVDAGTSIIRAAPTELTAVNVDEAESLPLDTAIMSWYHVSGDQAQYLVNFLQTQFYYTNSFIRTGLFRMVLQMKQQMLEMINLRERTSEQELEIAQLKIKNKDLEDLNETLETDNQRIPKLQNQVDEIQNHFSDYIAGSVEMQANAVRVDELESLNTALKINLADSKQRRLLLETDLADSKQRRLHLETELKSSKAKIHGGLDLFKENVTPLSFPVMQNNGHMVDFHRIISKWAKTAEEDDNTASRSFMCSIENKHTSLVQPRIIDQIQRIAIELGLRAEPPLLFERKIDDTWTQLSNKHHIQLIATVCYLYAHRKTTQTADAVVNKERLSFVISAPQPNHTQAVLRCHHAGVPIRIQINRVGWNPFPNMIFATEDH